MRRYLVLPIGIASLLGLLTGCQPYEYHGTFLDSPKPISDFALARVDGGDFRYSEMETPLLVMFFGYTHCPDFCPTTLYTLRKVHDGLGEQADQIQVAFVTVDPERDTPEIMADYLRNIDPSFLGLREADSDKLAALFADFGVYAAVDQTVESSDDYLISHTSAVFVLDRSGLRLLIPYGTPAEDITSDLQHLLKEE